MLAARVASTDCDLLHFDRAIGRAEFDPTCDGKSVGGSLVQCDADPVAGVGGGVAVKFNGRAAIYDDEVKAAV